MTTCAIGVVAYETRRAMAEQLVADVQAEVINVDGGTLKCGGNHRHVWSKLAELGGREWSLCLEDDARPVDGFLEQLDQALTVAPSGVVSLYLGRLRPKQFQGQIQAATEKADANDACWIVGPRLYQAVGVAIRTELVEGMVEFTARKTYFQIDDAIALWAMRNQHFVAHTWPSLVEHRDVPSVEHRKREPGRVAWKVGTRDVWTSESFALG